LKSLLHVNWPEQAENGETKRMFTCFCALHHEPVEAKNQIKLLIIFGSSSSSDPGWFILFNFVGSDIGVRKKGWKRCE
jgi:hypothetical protein